MMRVKVMVAVVAVATVFAGACGASGDTDAATTTTATSGGGVAVSDPWARATAPTTKVGAAYFRIVNTGGDDTLVGVSVGADVAAEAQIHVTGDAALSPSTTAPAPDVHAEHSIGGALGNPPAAPGGGVTGMTQVTSVAVPAGATVAFEPGGSHVMLIGLVAPLEAGRSFPLTLEFERAGTQSITVEVRGD